MASKLQKTQQEDEAFFLNKAVFAIHIAPRIGRLTIVMRKTYNVLLKLAWEEWAKNPVEIRQRLMSEMHEKHKLTAKMSVSPAFTFSTKVGVILKALQLDRKNTKLIYAALDGLRTCKVEWNLMLDGGEMTFISGMLSEATISKGGAVTWSYGLNLFEMLLHPKVYQAIDLQLQTEFTRYASQALYENAIRYSNLNSTGWKDEEKWRQLLSSDGSPTKESYRSWKSRTLKSAMAELNVAVRCPITVKLEDKTGLDGKRQLRFILAEKPHGTLFPETPIPHDKKLLASLAGLGFNPAEIKELLENYDPDYVLGNLAYVEAKIAEGSVKSSKAYLTKALKEDFRTASAKAAKQAVVAKEIRNAAAESAQIAEAFTKFQTDRLHQKFEALGKSAQLNYFDEFMAQGVVSNPEVLKVLESAGVEAIFDPRSVAERSAAGSFYVWLRAHQRPMLTEPDELDRHVFAKVHWKVATPA